MTPQLVIIETHPVQYHAPIYRILAKTMNIPLTVIYESDCSIKGYRDQEFGESFAWDTDLMSGYESLFINRLKSRNLQSLIGELHPGALLILGYSHIFYRKAIWVALMKNYPILFRAETTDFNRQRSFAKAFLRDRILRYFYKRCAKLLYIGQNSLSHYKRLNCTDNKLIFSPYGVNLSTFRCDEDARSRLRSEMRKKLKIMSNDIAIIFSGKLVDRKGPHLLIQATQQLPKESRARIHVLFLGAGELENKLRLAAAQDPVIKTSFLGFQNQTKLSPFYHAADFLALPSVHSETWGLVVNEALHHGLPCVVSDKVGCSADLIESGITGFIHKSGSVGSLSAAILQAIELVNLTGIRDTCRQKVISYSLEHAAFSIAKAYTEALNTEINAKTQL